MTRADKCNRAGLVAIALLSLLSGSRWLLEGASPGLASRASTEAIGALMAAILWAGWQSLHGLGPESGIAEGSLGRGSWLPGAAGMLALCGPALGGTISRRHLNANNATLALALCPVVVAVTLSALGRLRAELTARLWPGLAGTAGLLLLLPEPRWTDWRFTMALTAMPVLVGVGASLYPGTSAISVRTEQQLRFGLSRPVLALLLSAVVYGLFSLASNGDSAGPAISFGSMGAAALDGVSLLLSLLALSWLGAERWTAQFLLAPLVALVEGVVLLRPILDLQSWAAFALLAVSGGYLLLVRGEEDPEAAGADR